MIETFSDDSTQDFTTNDHIDAIVQSYSDETGHEIASRGDKAGKKVTSDNANDAINKDIIVVEQTSNADKENEEINTSTSAEVLYEDKTLNEGISENVVTYTGDIDLYSQNANDVDKITSQTETGAFNVENVGTDTNGNIIGTFQLYNAEVDNECVMKSNEIGSIEYGQDVNEKRLVELYIDEKVNEYRIKETMDLAATVQPYSQSGVSDVINTNGDGTVELYTDERTDEYMMSRVDTVGREPYCDKRGDEEKILENNELAAVIEPFIDEGLDNTINNTELAPPMQFYSNDTAGYRIDDAIGLASSETYSDENEMIANCEIVAAVESITGETFDDTITNTRLTNTAQLYTNDRLHDYNINEIVISTADPYSDGIVNENGIMSNEVIESYNNLVEGDIINNDTNIVEPTELYVDGTMDEEMRNSVIAAIDSYNNEIADENVNMCVNGNVNTIVELYDGQTPANVDVAPTTELYSYDTIDEGINNTEMATMMLYNDDIVTEVRSNVDMPEMAEAYTTGAVEDHIIYENIHITNINDPQNYGCVNEFNVIRNVEGPPAIEYREKTQDRLSEGMVIATVESYNQKIAGDDRSDGIMKIAATIELYSEESMNLDRTSENIEATTTDSNNYENFGNDKIVITENTECITEKVAKSSVETNIEKDDKSADENITPTQDKVKKRKRERKTESRKAKKAKAKGTKARAILNESFNDEKVDEKTWKIREKSAIALIQNTWILPFKTASAFQCFYCEESHGDIAVITNHTMTTHNNPSKQQIRRAMEKKKKHHLIKVNITKLACKLCDDAILDFTDLKRHVARKHNVEVDEINDGVIPFKIVNGECECVLCSVKFAGSKGLSSHMNEHYPHHTCLECGLGFMTIERLKNHSLVHTLEVHTCEICGKKYKSESAKYNHFRVVHKNERVSKCPHCIETFKNYYTRQKHIFTVHGIKVNQYNCEICPHSFLMKHLLISHMETVHTKRTKALDRPHKCTECDMRFTRLSYLADHMVKHTGTRNFQCSLCQKCYGRKKTLTAHKRKVHSIAKLWVKSKYFGK